MIKVFSQPSCAPCKRAIKMLEESGVEYQVYDVTQDEDAREAVLELGASTTPVVMKDEIFWFEGFTGQQVELLSLWIQEENPNQVDDGIWLD